CWSNKTGPPNPMPQRSMGMQANGLHDEICSSIHSRPPARSVARDSRAIIRPESSKTAIENLVPPISMASVCKNFFGTRGSRTLLHDRDRSHEITEARRFYG